LTYTADNFQPARF